MTCFRIIILSIFIVSSNLFAQTVIVTYNNLDQFDATLHELFYCSLNNLGESQNVYLEARISKDGETILVAQSGAFILEEGLTTINSFNASTILQSMSNISTQYIDDNIYDEIVQSGYIPSGNYVFCLIVYDMSEQALSNPDICNVFTSWPVSPPRLLIPIDNAQIDTDLPLFSWTHAMPYNPSLSYNLEIVELFDGQGPFDAFQSNYLFFKSDDLRLNSYQYLVSSPVLNKCKSYAWRVKGNYDDNKSAYEFRVFNTSCDSIIEEDRKIEEEPRASNVYYEFSRKIDGALYLVNGNFKIVIDNPYSHIEKLSYSILDNDNVDLAASNTLYNVKSKDESLSSGKNIFIVNIDRLGLLDDQIYVLKLNNLKRTHYLRFKYEQD